ncbi:hypothetical protein [Arthrobacter sp. ISL-65]|uniref:hypothetical protein n=1 Tax=Arthrobacter sp. ISL-65 TaxID=2819112 RepID=UPI001BE86150|nr:hypothetical protein [Arthrobacter sp. ISL-65]MBT2548150.1 hypothetical protein [Arthrobacter sp. ISL-65]
MLSTPVEVSTICQGQRRDGGDHTQFLDRHWTKRQLEAAAEVDRRVQRHPQHMLARMALANYGNSLGLDRIRASVARSLGGISGTHYVVAALHLAHLALSFPHTLSSTQQALLLAPVEAAEMAQETSNDAFTEVEIAA